MRAELLLPWQQTFKHMNKWRELKKCGIVFKVTLKNLIKIREMVSHISQHTFTQL